MTLKTSLIEDIDFNEEEVFDLTDDDGVERLNDRDGLGYPSRHLVRTVKIKIILKE